MSDPEYVDFKPAPPGWRLVYLLDEDDPSGDPFVVADMPGWLVQRDRHGVHVTAAQQEDCDVTTAESTSNFWRVLGPSDPLPSAEDAASERTERAKRRPKPTA